MDTLEKRLQKRIHVSLYALLFLATLLGLSLILESCANKCTVTNQYVYYEPVFTTTQELRAQVSLEPPREINALGKLYFKDNILFVNEPGEGIHIIDDTDKKNPVIKNFLKIPGNYDLAIKGNTLYADSYIDIVLFDISTVTDIKEIGRLEGILKNYSSLGLMIDETRGIITNWVETERVEQLDSDCDMVIQPWGGFWYRGGVLMTSEAAVNFDSKAAVAPGNGSGPGLGGSLARFTISQNHLYLLDGGELQVVDVTSETEPVAGGRQYINWDIETIFPYKDNLFIGARSGMHIIDVSQPQSPSIISTYQHVNSCDPVVVSDDYAYVTLRSGNPTCEGFNNQLEIIDIKDLSKPELLKVYPMTNPHGLGIDGNTLFLCDGDAGIKVFDVTDKLTVDQHLLAHHDNIHAYDVIPFNNILMLIGEDGIFQYDYSDPEKLTLLSHIQVGHD